MLGYPLPVSVLWQSARSSRGQSRHVPPGQDALIRLRLRLESLLHRCNGSLVEASPAASGGRLRRTSETVRYWLGRYVGAMSSIGPRREAITTSLSRYWGTP